jgi:hypothetical protein
VGGNDYTKTMRWQIVNLRIALTSLPSWIQSSCPANIKLEETG